MVDQEYLQAQAKAYLASRNAPKSAWYYWISNWRLMAIYYPIYAGLAALAWYGEFYYVATAVFWFWIGRAIRDFQWYRSLANQGDAADELMDWEKIRKLAEPDSVA